MRFAFGLGNPEAKYDNTPHNVGYATIDKVVSMMGQETFRTNVAIRKEDGSKVFLCKASNVYMNESGGPIKELLRYYKVSPSINTLLVVHDDLDLPIGSLRGKLGGGTGGHNGIRSIIEELDTQDFYRIKIGIGRHEYMDPYTYVLSKMDDDRIDRIEKTIKQAAERVLQWLKGELNEGFKDE
jgi:PTH1 family peptidyl-tRNA hydrolase